MHEALKGLRPKKGQRQKAASKVEVLRKSTKVIDVIMLQR